MKILPYFDYKLAFKKNMEILKGLHVPIKEEIKPYNEASSVHKDEKTQIVVVTSQDFLAILEDDIEFEEELPYIDDDEMEDESPFVLLDNEIEDPDLIEARRLHEL